MTMKPAVITAAQVSEQTLKLTKTRRDLELSLRLLERRMAATERSLSENEALRATVAKLREDSLGQFQMEWRKRKELYPDVRFAIITKTSELITPPKKDKAGTDKAGDAKPK